MNTFLHLPPEQRRRAFQQVDAAKGLQAVSVEKDFWVCWILQMLFTLPETGSHLTFKGGTSLSKAWKYIERFSEDIDLIVDKQTLGISEDNDPEKAPSKKQRRTRLEGLQNKARAWVQEHLKLALEKTISAILSDGTWKLEVDASMPDGQCLLFSYPTVFSPDAAGYVRPVVKIELGARSDNTPSEEKIISPYVLEHFPQLGGNASINVRVLCAERTFWEKACLLHEETFRPQNKPMKPRMSRHYYDLWRLIEAGVAERALLDKTLFRRVVAHREIYFNISWVDYTAHKPGTFRLIPQKPNLSYWEHDYQEMQKSMIFGASSTFEKILADIKKIENKINTNDCE
jgi:predicted nucleotidyltransferase component of viral defense system